MVWPTAQLCGCLGVSKDSADPPGGTIVRDPASGDSDRILKDDAQSLVQRVIAQPFGGRAR